MEPGAVKKRLLLRGGVIQKMGVREMRSRAFSGILERQSSVKTPLDDAIDMEVGIG
jgi:hypothetical protein